MVSIDLDSSFNNAKAKINRSYFISSDVKKNQQFGTVNAEKKQDKGYSKVLFPAGMIASGAILLYFGIKSSNRAKLLKDFVESQTEFMNNQADGCKDKVRLIINKGFQEVKLYIDKFYERYSGSFGEFKHTKIKDSKNINQVLDAEQKEFSHLSKVYDESHKAGPSDMDEFSVYQRRIVNSINDEVSGYTQKTLITLKDNIVIPPFKDGRHQTLVDDAEAKLGLVYKNLTEDLWQSKDLKISEYIRDFSGQMADVIIDIRSSKVENQNYLLNTLLLKLKSLKAIPKDFTLTNHEVFKNGSLKSLNETEIKPQKLSDELTEIIGDNIYLEILKKQNFGKLTSSKIKDIFTAVPYDCNLKDLGVLIDRLRIRQAINQTKRIDNTMYDIVITKLEVLSDRLYKYGHNELFTRCSKDFDLMKNDSQKKAALYLVYNSARKLGYVSLKDMNKHFRMINPEYKDLNFVKYLSEFINKPEIYSM